MYRLEFDVNKRSLQLCLLTFMLAKVKTSMFYILKDGKVLSHLLKVSGMFLQILASRLILLMKMQFS